MSALQAAGAAAAAVTGAAAPYWRSAGLSHGAYANACAVHLRKCLKEPFKTQTATLEQVHYKFAAWVGGVPQKPKISNMIPKEAVRTTRRTTRIKVAEVDLETEEAEWDMEDEKPQRPLRPVVERFKIHHEQNVSDERLKELGVSRWSKWECGPGVTYAWHWKVDELVYISKGSVEVVPDGCTDGAFFYAGDIVRFPKWFVASMTFDEDYEQYYKFMAYGD